ncbi:MAG: hypothetical protein M0R03_21940 [Novosphingobium sp.]|nr:hypothetical protein [Novosphingobium sp.]
MFSLKDTLEDVKGGLSEDIIKSIEKDNNNIEGMTVDLSTDPVFVKLLSRAS